MTPSLTAVYDELVAEASAHEELVSEVRAAFQRLGAFSPSDPWFEERSAALWDRVLLEPRVGAALAGGAHANVLQQLGRAQRGLFEVHPCEKTVDMLCVVRGAAFRLAESDDAARAMSRGGEGGWIDGHVIPTTEGVALLPGATEPMRALIARELPFDALLDGLLGMRHRLASLSRMKAKQVYRAEAFGR